MDLKDIALIGAPTDIGASVRGGSMGPEAMRVAGLDKALKALGYTVIDRGNLSGPPVPVEEVIADGHKHLPECVKWGQLVREAVHHSLLSEELPILMGGDHSLALGSIAAVAQYCASVDKKLSVLWLDAHADFNTAGTSPSGNIHGMPVSALFGLGHPELVQIKTSRRAVEFDHFVQLGIRSVDAIEKLQLSKHDIHIFDMRMIDEYGMRAVMKKALDTIAAPDTHLHVSFDIDFLDPSIAPGVATSVKGGPTYREAQLCMEMIHDSGLLGSLDIVELNPAYDVHNQTAELAVELVESIFGKQILARKQVH